MQILNLVKSDYSNITTSIQKKIGINLYNKKDHPIEIVKNFIYTYFDSCNIPNLSKFDEFTPYVSVEDNFDKLLIPKDHPARKKTDTYYLNENVVLRTHTSAHQNHLLTSGYENFLVTGDVYRKDEIDKHHYPVFTQMEGMIKLNHDENPKEKLDFILGGLIKKLFPEFEYRINDDYFPFTNPSYEFEIKNGNKWIEILGCGVVQPEIIKNNNTAGTYIAFGLGLDRCCMIAFDIPDIRYLWSTDEKFLNQFKNKNFDQIKFKPYSNLPNISKDISFWINEDNLDIKNNWSNENDFFELARDTFDDWIEEICLSDIFVHPKTKKCSRMYRLIFSPNDHTLSNPSTFNSFINNKLTEFTQLITNKLQVCVR